MKRILIFILLAITSPLFASDVKPDSYGQWLVDNIAKNNTGLFNVSLHLIPPGGKQTVIALSYNRSKIGVISDDVDKSVLTTGKTVGFITKIGNYQVLMPLLNLRGDVIGAIGVTYVYHEGDNRDVMDRRTVTIRNDLRTHIVDAASLFEPHPYKSGLSTHSLAQMLVDGAMAAYPDLEICTIYATSAGNSDMIALGSSVGGIGKEADDGGFTIVGKGKQRREELVSGNQLSIKMPLHNRVGKMIGVIKLVYPLKKGDDSARLFERSAQISAEVSGKISKNDILGAPSE